MPPGMCCSKSISRLARLTSPLSNNATAQTLTAQTTTLDTSALAVSADQPEDESPRKPLVAEVSGNSGQLSYQYPLQVAAGPPGTAPTLKLSYSSGTTNQR